MVQLLARDAYAFISYGAAGVLNRSTPVELRTDRTRSDLRPVFALARQ